MKNYPNTTQISTEDAEHSPFEWRALLQKRNFLRKFITRRRVVAMVAIALIVLGGYGIYEKYFHLTSAEKAKKELAAAVAAVSKHIILPEGDEPVLATVVDAAALKAQQAFFSGSVNGDQLLLFPRNLKAVLWSPSRSVIVNVGPIQQQSPAAGGSQLQVAVPNNAADQTAPAALLPGVLSVEVRNGTGKTGYGATIAKQISANGNYSIIQVADAAAKNYAKTLIVDHATSPEKKALAISLAEALGAEVASTFPPGEKNTQADILVILGGK